MELIVHYFHEQLISYYILFLRTKQYEINNSVSVRHIALNIIRRNTSIDASVKRKRHMAALNDDVRTTLIRGLN